MAPRECNSLALVATGGRGDAWVPYGALELVVVRADIGVGAVGHAEATRYGAKLDEAELLVEMAGTGIGRDHGIELQHSKAVVAALRYGVLDKGSAHALAPCC